MLRSIILTWLVCLLASAEARTEESIYVFSNDTRFVEISPAEERIVDVGSLWHMDVLIVGSVLRPSTQGSIFLETKVWKLLKIENPTREQWEQRGLVKIDRTHKGGLRLDRFIAPPDTNASLQGGRILQIQGELRLFLTWVPEAAFGTDHMFVSIHDRRGKMLRRVENFAVWNRSCLEESLGRIYTPVFGEPRDIRALDLQSGTVSSSSYEHLGARTFFSKFAAAASPEDCLLLVGDRQRKRGIQTFHLYGYVNERVLSKFQLSLDADYQLLSRQEAIVAEEKEYLEGGGLRRPGRLHVLDYRGNVVHTLELPEGGRLAAFSEDGKIGIYLSPRKVTILNLSDFSVQGEVDIPFEHGHVALLR